MDSDVDFDGDGKKSDVAEVVREEDELDGERGEIASLSHRVEFDGSGQRLLASRPRVTSAWSTPHLGTDCQIEKIQTFSFTFPRRSSG